MTKSRLTNIFRVEIDLEKYFRGDKKKCLTPLFSCSMIAKV